MVEGFRSWYKIPPRRACERGSITLETFLRRRKYPAPGRELFSLRKKRIAGIRPSAWQKAGSLYRLNPTPFPPLKNYGFQGDLIPLARGAQGQGRRP